MSATFFVPGITIEAWPDLCRRILDEAHEIGHNGYHHITPVNLDEGAEREQIEKGLEAMDRVLHGHRAIGYRSPGADLSPNSATLADLPQMEFVPTPTGVLIEGLSDPEKCERMWLADLDYMVEEIPGGVYSMCVHPEVIGRGARVRVLERMIARGKRHQVQFMTARASARDWISRHPFDRAPTAGG